MNVSIKMGQDHYYQLTWRLMAGLISLQGKEQKSFLVLAYFWKQILMDPKENSKEDIALVVCCLDECLGINSDIELLKGVALLEAQIKNKASRLKEIGTLTKSTFLSPDKENWNWFLALLNSCEHFYTLEPIIQSFFYIVKNDSIATEVRIEALELLSRISGQQTLVIKTLEILWRDISLSTLAHTKISVMFEYLGEPLSEEELSREWEKPKLEDSIIQGKSPDGNSELRLGWGYQNGRWKEKSLKLALEWQKKAAEKNNFGAHANLGFMYLTGQGVTVCHRKAKVYFNNAKEKHPYSKLGLFIIDFENFEDAKKHFFEIFSGDSLRSLLNTLKDESNQEACDAQFYIGFLYEHGLGVCKDSVAARNNYQKAVNKKIKLAEKFLERVFRENRTQETVSAYESMRGDAANSGVLTYFETLRSRPHQRSTDLPLSRIDESAFKRESDQHEEKSGASNPKKEPLKHKRKRSDSNGEG